MNPAARAPTPARGRRAGAAFLPLCVGAIGSLVGATTSAVLPPEAHRAFVARYLEQAEIRAVAAHTGTGIDARCDAAAPGRACVCRARYRIVAIIAAPATLGFGRGDRLALEYPCDARGTIAWSGSFAPWATPAERGHLALRLRVADLLRVRSGSWELDNERRLFAPVLPAHRRPESKR